MYGMYKKNLAFPFFFVMLRKQWKTPCFISNQSHVTSTPWLRKKNQFFNIKHKIPVKTKQFTTSKAHLQKQKPITLRWLTEKLTTSFLLIKEKLEKTSYLLKKSKKKTTPNWLSLVLTFPRSPLLLLFWRRQAGLCFLQSNSSRKEAKMSCCYARSCPSAPTYVEKDRFAVASSASQEAEEATAKEERFASTHLLSWHSKAGRSTNTKQVAKGFLSTKEKQPYELRFFTTSSRCFAGFAVASSASQEADGAEKTKLSLAKTSRAFLLSSPFALRREATAEGKTALLLRTKQGAKDSFKTRTFEWNKILKKKNNVERLFQRLSSSEEPLVEQLVKFKNKTVSLLRCLKKTLVFLRSNRKGDEKCLSAGRSRRKGYFALLLRPAERDKERMKRSWHSLLNHQTERHSLLSRKLQLKGRQRNTHSYTFETSWKSKYPIEHKSISQLFVNMLLKNGKKSKAEKIFYKSLILLKNKQMLFSEGYPAKATVISSFFSSNIDLTLQTKPRFLPLSEEYDPTSYLRNVLKCRFKKTIIQPQFTSKRMPANPLIKIGDSLNLSTCFVGRGFISLRRFLPSKGGKKRRLSYGVGRREGTFPSLCKGVALPRLLLCSPKVAHLLSEGRSFAPLLLLRKKQRRSTVSFAQETKPELALLLLRKKQSRQRALSIDQLEHKSTDSKWKKAKQVDIQDSNIYESKNSHYSELKSLFNKNKKLIIKASQQFQILWEKRLKTIVSTQINKKNNPINLFFNFKKKVFRASFKGETLGLTLQDFFKERMSFSNKSARCTSLSKLYKNRKSLKIPFITIKPTRLDSYR